MASVKALAIRALRKAGLVLLPRKSRMPFRYRMYTWEDTCENELLYIHRLSDTHDTAIDAGANLGLYSYHLSKYYSKVYSFEINDDLTKELADYNRGNIEIMNQGLSSESGTMKLYIPLRDGVPLIGWASLTPGNYPGIDEHQEKTVKVCQLDTLDLQAVSIIKIDVEGHEMEVLKGAAQTIAKNRPVVLLEARPSNMESIASFFAGLDYRERTLHDLIGIPGTEGNPIFVPSERSRSRAE